MGGNSVGAMLAVVIGIVLGFLGSWRLSLTILAVLPFIMVAMYIITKMMLLDGGGEVSDKFQESDEIATETILNIRTVRALGCEGYMKTLYSNIVWRVANNQAGGSWKAGVSFGFGNAIMFGVYILAFGYGAVLIDNGNIDGMDMYQSLFTIMFGAFGAGLAMAFVPDAQKGLVAAHDTFAAIDRESLIDAMNPTGCVKDIGDGSIEFQDVRFHFPHRPELVVLRKVNLKIMKGQSAAFVGPSGSGKSTIFQLLLRFYDPLDGRVLVGNENLTSFDIAFWRSQVGFVGQEPVLFDMTLEENIKYGKSQATRQEVEDAASIANMEYVLSGTGQVKWEDNVGPKGGQLSGGQKQRCAIARAVIRDPPYLILDEATSALDSSAEGVVQDALEKARKGRTTLAIAHRLSTIRNYDIIFVLRGGQIREEGKHEELMHLKGLYWSMVQCGGR